MKILQVRPCSGGRRIAAIDIEIAPGVRAVDVSLIRKPDGSMRVFGHSLTFDRATADDLACAAVAAGGWRYERG
jgi:hypothetical protein